MNWWRQIRQATGRGWGLLGLSVWHACVFSFVVVGISGVGAGFGLLLLPAGFALLRESANKARRRALEWGGVAIEDPYRPLPQPAPGFAGRMAGLWAQASDPQTWRDLAWSILDPVIGAFIAGFAALMFAYGVYGYVVLIFWQPLTHAGMNDWYTFVHVSRGGHLSFLRWAIAPVATAFAVGSVRAAPALIRLHARWTASLLGPTPEAREAALSRRVEQLTSTRADAVDNQAAELRRIERDLHDGAQARLVAMGMNLGAAEALLDEHPEAAKALLAEAREASAKALTELRELVRGIHPPVLADRGLGDAVRALALDSPLHVEVSADLPGRLEPAVESAAYFAVSELLTNAAKHAKADTVRLDLWHREKRLTVMCTDDGRGGANVGAGTGLAGIERRIGTFDGVMAVRSPVGGPTVITLEIPCALSSEKTSSF